MKKNRIQVMTSRPNVPRPVQEPGPLPSTHQAQNKTTLVTFLLVLFGVMVINYRMVQPYLLAVTMGGILALLSYPVFERLRSHRFRPSVAAATVTIGIIVLVIVPTSIFSMLVVKQAIVVGESLAKNESLSLDQLMAKVAELPVIQEVIGSPEAIARSTRGWLQNVGKGMSSAILGVAANIPELLLQLALASIACFFFLVDGKAFLRWTGEKLPLDQDVQAKVAHSFGNTAVSVIWATLAAATTQSVIMVGSFLALQVPGAFLAAGATFIFAWIPIVGSTPVWISGAIYLYMQGSVVKTVLMLILGSFTGVVDNFVRPLVLKGRSEMHPLVSLVAIFGGIQMFGIIGVFIGPIVVAVFISLLQIWPSVGFRYGMMTPLLMNKPDSRVSKADSNASKADATEETRQELK